jgi:acylphosphatase
MTDLPRSDSGFERREIYFSGRVQGVGFRFTTQNTAEGFNIVGFVRNLPDGRVECVVEGEGSELDRFISAVESAMHGHIEGAEISQAVPTKEFMSFSIAR